MVSVVALSDISPCVFFNVPPPTYRAFISLVFTTTQTEICFQRNSFPNFKPRAKRAVSNPDSTFPPNSDFHLHKNLPLNSPEKSIQCRPARVSPCIFLNSPPPIYQVLISLLVFARLEIFFQRNNFFKGSKNTTL